MKKKKLKSLDRMLLSGATIGFMSKIGNVTLAFANQWMLVKLLGLKDFGIYVFAMTLITVLSIVCNFGFDSSSVRFVAQYDSSEQNSHLATFIHYTNKIVIICSVVTASLFAGISFLLRDSMSENTLNALFFAALILPLFSIMKKYQAVHKGFKKILFATFPEQVVRHVIISICLLYVYVNQVEWGLVNALTLNLIATGVSLLFVVIALKTAVYKGDQERLTTEIPTSLWNKTSFGMVLITGSNILMSNLDILMLGIMVSKSEVGLYSIPMRIAGFLTFFLVAANGILAPVVASLKQSNDIEKMQHVVQKVMLVVISLACITSILVLTNGSLILNAFGSEFEQSIGILYVLVIAQCINTCFGPVGLILNMTGYQNITSKILISTVILKLLLNCILIPKFGPLGAAYGSLVCMIVWNCAFAFFTWKIYHFIPIPSMNFITKSQNNV